MTSLLNPVSPYSFDLFYTIHARYPHPSLFTLRDGAYYRAIDTTNGLSLVKVMAQENDLSITALIGDLPIAPIKHIFAVDTNLTGFYTFAEQDEKLATVIEPLIGLPLYRSESLYEALIFVIIEQHIAWVNAQKAQRVLIEWGNHYIEHEDIRYYAMPKPEQLANASIDDLRPLKITFKRMQLLIDLAQQFMDDPNFLSEAATRSADALYKQLLSIKGIGHWTASVVVARALGLYQFVPHNDVALQAAVAKYFDVEKSAQATSAIFGQYGDYAGLAAHFTLMKWVLDQYPIVNG